MSNPDEAFYKKTKADLEADQRALSAAIAKTNDALALHQWYKIRRGPNHPMTQEAALLLHEARREQEKLECQIAIAAPFIAEYEKANR